MRFPFGPVSYARTPDAAKTKMISYYASRMFLAFSAGLSMLVSGCLFATKSELDHPSVCGNVLDADSHAPIVDATVTVRFCLDNGPSGDRLSIRTDSNGWFYLSSPNCMGNFRYMLSITHESYDSLLLIDAQSSSGLFSDCIDHDYPLEKSRWPH
jgi:hypothetical protein